MIFSRWFSLGLIQQGRAVCNMVLEFTPSHCIDTRSRFGAIIPELMELIELQLVRAATVFFSYKDIQNSELLFVLILFG